MLTLFCVIFSILASVPSGQTYLQVSFYNNLRASNQWSLFLSTSLFSQTVSLLAPLKTLKHYVNPLISQFRSSIGFKGKAPFVSIAIS